VFRFLHVTTFSTGFLFGPNPDGFPAGPAGATERRAVESFLFAFDSNHKPIVGQQITLTRDNGASVGPRIDLLVARAEAGDCDLAVHGHLGTGARQRGFLYVGGGWFQRDRALAPHISVAQLRAPVDKKQESLTFTCAPLGTGHRFALDRDRDGWLDGNDWNDESD
jgi:hypothetical protein